MAKLVMRLTARLLGVGLFALPCAAQFTEQLTVVGSRLPSAPLRRVWVWPAEELNNLPLRHWSDLLRLVAGAGLARRGVFGIQADASFLGLRHGVGRSLPAPLPTASRRAGAGSPWWS